MHVPFYMRSVLMLGVLALPFWSNPLRYSPHEPHRGVVALVLVALSVIALRGVRVRRGGEWLVFAIGASWGSWLLSSVLALSPALALMGTSLRADGIVLQMVLGGALVAGFFSPVRVIGRWLWGVGLGVSLVIVAQWLGWLPSHSPGTTPRPSGTWGLPPFTSGWLVLVIVWAWVARPRMARPLVYSGYRLGLFVMVFALMLTGTRGSALALCGAMGMAFAMWGGKHRGRWLSATVIVVVIGVLGVLLLNQLRFIPLFERIDPHTTGYTHRFRARLWQNTQDIARFDSPVFDITLMPDPRHVFRPLVGYGPGHFEQLHRPYAYADRYFKQQYARNTAIDRAHNDWLDILVTQGWLGVLSRAGMWLAVYGVALRRLGGFHPGLLGLPVLGGMVGGVALWGHPWLPLGVTVGVVVGMGIGVLWRSDDFLPDAPGELALLMLVAHIIEMQFLFVVIANTWLFWLMLGVLLADRQPMLDVSVGWTMLPVVGVLFIRQWFPVPAAISAPVAEVVLLTVGILLVVWPRKAYRWQYVAVAVILLVGASYVLVDTQADQRYRDTLDATEIAHLRPLDVPLQVEAAFVALNRAETLSGYGWEQRADRLLTHLTRLNRYEPQVAYGLGRLATLREEPSATGYFRVAHTLSPDNPDYDEGVVGE